MPPWARCTSVSHISAFCLVMAAPAPVQIGHTEIRVCVRVCSCWENRYTQLRSQSVLFIVAWEQAPELMFLVGEYGLPTDLLLAT